MYECGTVSQYTNGGCRCVPCKAAKSASGKKYYKNNKQKHIEYCQKNRQRRIETASKWYKENRERAYEHSRSKDNRRRAAKSIKFTVDQLAVKLDYWGRKCYLKLEGCTGEYKHLDHVIPLSRGGLHALPNLRPACQSCNLRKGNKLLKELI